MRTANWDQTQDLTTVEGLRQAMSRRRKAYLNGKDKIFIDKVNISEIQLAKNAQRGTRILDKLALDTYAKLTTP